MTRRLEELFNLSEPDAVESISETSMSNDEIINARREELDGANDIIDRINAALPQVYDLDEADSEMDELATLAKDKFNDLMDLGMNVEARFSGTILQTAGVLLGHAIAAKQAKIDKKLRMVDLQLKKMRLDQTAASAKEKSNIHNTFDGTAVVLDRNELLRQILAGGSSNLPKKIE